jgi:hypothetical protein
MPGPGSARHDLCSIRAADEQEELAEAVRGGFSADGYPPGDDDPPVPRPATGRHGPLSGTAARCASGRA